MGMLAGVTDCRSQKCGCKGRWALGFKPRHSSHRKRGPHGSGVNREDHMVLKGKGENHVVLKEKREDHEVLGERKEDHVVLECSFLPHSLGSKRDFARKKRAGEKGLLLVDHEKVPHSFGLTGDCSSHPADGARSLNHRLLLLFLRYSASDWAGGEGRAVSLWVF